MILRAVGIRIPEPLEVPRVVARVEFGDTSLGRRPRASGLSYFGCRLTQSVQPWITAIRTSAAG